MKVTTEGHNNYLGHFPVQLMCISNCHWSFTILKKNSKVIFLVYSFFFFFCNQFGVCCCRWLILWKQWKCWETILSVSNIVSQHCKTASQMTPHTLVPLLPSVWFDLHQWLLLMWHKKPHSSAVKTILCRASKKNADEQSPKSLTVNLK